MSGELRPGDTLHNPVTGERFAFRATAATTAGGLLAFDLALRAGGAVPMLHVHPVQTERFEVVTGRMRFRLGLRTLTAGPGDVVVVAPGVVHGFANTGDTEALVRVDVTPALAMERMLADVVSLARAGRLTRRGIPRSLYDLAALAGRYESEARAPLLGVRLQRWLLRPWAPEACGRRAGSYPWATGSRHMRQSAGPPGSGMAPWARKP